MPRGSRPDTPGILAQGTFWPGDLLQCGECRIFCIYFWQALLGGRDLLRGSGQVRGVGVGLGCSFLRGALPWRLLLAEELRPDVRI